MQQLTVQIRDKLLTGIDQDYNVVNMDVVGDVLSQLENLQITKEALEISRLGKHINEIRRKAIDKNFANRTKRLLKKWRQMLAVDSHSTAVNGAGLRPSSLPSSASTSPSRPSTPSMTAFTTCQPVSPHVKTNSNKRSLTPCCDDGRVSKRPRLNEILVSPQSVTDGGADKLNSSCALATRDASPQVSPEASKTVSARRKNATSRLKDDGDVLRQRLESIKQSLGRVKTTQELVEEMAQRSHSPGYLTPKLVSQSPSLRSLPNQINEETKSELLKRFLDSQEQDTETSLPSSDSDEKPQEEKETVEEILSRLPPINVPSVLSEIEELIVQEEEEDFDIEGLIPVLPKPKPEVGPKSVENLHNAQKESFNGNFNHDGEFKEWFEVVTKPTKDNNLLHILPYSVIE